MMPTGAQWRLVLVVLAGYLLHVAIGSRIEVFGARPHIGLTVLTVSCIFVGPGPAAMLGFLLGVLEAWAVGLYIGSYLVSRSVVGWCIGALDRRMFRDQLAMAIGASLAGTVGANALVFVFAPQPDPMQWILRAAGSAAYNGLLAAPVYFIVRRIVRPTLPT